MKHLGTSTIKTPRLVLRRFTIEDAEAMYSNWASSPEVTKFLKWPPHKDVSVTEDILSEWISRYVNPDFYQWVITFSGEDMPIGTIACVGQNDEVGMLHIGYCIGQKWWNTGVTSEALKAVIGYLFDTVGANRIEAVHDPNNPNSGKVMLKCGMKYEGTMRKADVNNQGICDACMYSILREEYNGS